MAAAKNKNKSPATTKAKPAAGADDLELPDFLNRSRW